MSIKENANFLKLAYTRTNYIEILEEAEELGLSCKDFLERLLEKEAELRKAHGIKKRISYAKFPYRRYLSDYDTGHMKREVARKIDELKSLEFIEKRENVILIGNPGTGKTHLAVGLGTKACEDGMKVLFSSVPNLVLELKEAMSLNQITAYKRKFESYDLVILDELGYVSFDKEGIEILFNLLSSRNDKGSIIITTNYVFERWVEVFKDPILTSAIVDRLAYKAHVLDMTGESYRVKETISWLPNRLKNNSLQDNK